MAARRIGAMILAGIVVVAALRGSDRATDAAPPWQALIPFKQTEADPKKDYLLTEKNGPWLILCATFAGDKAEEQSKALVLELRKDLKLTAYRHKQHYDFTKKEAGKGFNKFGAPKMMKPMQDRVYDEIAVLVGDWETVDDPALQKTLQRIKFSPAKTLALTKESSQRYAGLRNVYKQMSGSSEDDKKGPMGAAFVTRNPMLPEENKPTNGVDKFVYEMNKDVSHSLLKNPGKYTVKIATFRGSTALGAKDVAEFETKGKPGRLVEAAEKSHKLVEALRAKGVEAYEFHDRYESVVTVGNFEWVGSPRADGKQEINPQIHKIMQQYGAQQTAMPGSGGKVNGLQPKVFAGCVLDVQPMPVEVPRYSPGADYRRRVE